MTWRVAAAAAAIAATVSVAPAAASPDAPLPRLEGTWKMRGRIVVAQNLADTKVGDRVADTWVFRPVCAAGSCDVRLTRRSQRRAFRLRRKPDSYAGSERYDGTFVCNGREYPRASTYITTWVVYVTRSRNGRATAIKGVGGIVGRSPTGLPCAQIVSQEAVTFTATRSS